MTGRNREVFREYLADFFLFSPMGVGFPLQYKEVMEMDLDLIDSFYARKSKVIDAMNKTK